ncbi:MAG: BMC domain-containing protein, partial [Deltaproteobacteria bacterium]|nr:BMC domain-containing protein [Deltaproteobacteria bacterium]
MELKAIAMIELNSIAKGVQTADEMLKTADVDLV